MEIQTELLAMPEMQRLERVEQFKLSIGLLEGNARELHAALQHLTLDPSTIPLSSVQTRATLEQALREVLRLLHNFVAAAKTLVDHTRVLYGELYRGRGTFDDYEEEVRQRFASVPLVQFVQSLRNFYQHVRLPRITYSITSCPPDQLRRRLHLAKRDLLTFGSWNAGAQKYLQNAPDQLDVVELLEGYIGRVRAFHEWMNERLRVIHAEDLAVVNAKKKEGLSAMAPLIPGFLENSLKIWSQGVGSVSDIFAPAFDEDDWEKLSEHTSWPAWVEAALQVVEQRFGKLPADLAGRIRAAAESSSAQ